MRYLRAGLICCDLPDAQNECPGGAGNRDDPTWKPRFPLELALYWKRIIGCFLAV